MMLGTYFSLYETRNECIVFISPTKKQINIDSSRSYLEIAQIHSTAGQSEVTRHGTWEAREG